MIGINISISIDCGGGGGGSSEPFDPATLFAASEEGAWYDPSDLTTVFTDTGGTTPASVGDAVARINDKSGNGHHATQGALASRPILRQEATGEYYLEFDGSNDFIRSNVINWGQFITATTAFDATGQSGSGVIYECGRAGTLNAISTIFLPGGTAYEGRFSNANASQGIRRQITRTPSQTDVFTAIMDKSAATPSDAMVIRLNGAEETGTFLQSNIQADASFNDYYLEIGRYYNLDNGHLNGKLYGLLLVGKILTGTDLAGVEDFMAGKSGVTLS